MTGDAIIVGAIACAGAGLVIYWLFFYEMGEN